MPTIPPSRLISLLNTSPSNIRNICILAHVDHGKTSMTDSLIATNGIISPKQAGKVRYLDSRPDEQVRGITMESSAISLYFSMIRPKRKRKRHDETNGHRSEAGLNDLTNEDDPKQEEFIINLIDSPGHIDFSSEVSTASRLSDAAVILVDAVEGVQGQTVTVLRQVWIEKLKPLLVINKIDRLVTELKMSPAEAYAHLTRILEGVNAVIGGFFQGERMEEDLEWREKGEKRTKKQQEAVLDAANQSASDSQFEELDDEDLYFAPEKSNVIFASAIDGWAFTVRQFAAIYEKKLGIKRELLEKVLWGDFYLDPKTRKVLGPKHLKGRNLKPIFVQLVLEPIWAVYEATVGGHNGKGDPALLEKITKSLNITVPPYVTRSREPKVMLQAVISSWLPLSTALLVSVIEYLPSPPEAQSLRLPEIIDDSIGSVSVDDRVRDAMVNSKTAGSDPVVAYISKMVAIQESELPSNKRRTGTALTPEEARELARRKRAEIEKARAEAVDVNGVAEKLGDVSVEDSTEDSVASQQPDDPEHLIGYARLYSGTLSVGDEVYVLPPKFNPVYPHAHPESSKVTVTALYLLMGRSLETLTTVKAGSIFGIEGLEGKILKTGTLCSQLEGSVNLSRANSLSQPIVRVALEPVNPLDLNKMIRGLKLLEQADPCAIYEQMESGEHVILTAGEVHLERCLIDLRERFARCDIQPGEPIVPYRETIIKAEEMAPLKNKDLPRGAGVTMTASKTLQIKIRVRPLPNEVTDFLIRNGGSIQRLYAEKKAREDASKQDGVLEEQSPTHGLGNNEKVASEQEMADDLGNEIPRQERSNLSLHEFRNQLQGAFDEVDEDKDIWTDIVSHISAFGPRRVGPNILVDATGRDTCKRFLFDHDHDLSGNSDTPDQSRPSSFSDTIAYAFQLAMSQGPLCREPMQGVAVFLEEITRLDTPQTSSHHDSLQHEISTPRSSTPVAESSIPTPTSNLDADTPTTTTATSTSRATGELLTTLRSSMHTTTLQWSPRLLFALYTATISAPPESLGAVYATLTRRRGSILSESILEGTPYFTITSLIPVAESWGFAEEIRKRTSGLAQPSLEFYGFGRLEEGEGGEDPFWVPRSEEELEDLGVHGERENVAKRYVDRVRRRKGLMVRETGVMGRKGAREGEKGRNLKSN